MDSLVLSLQCGKATAVFVPSKDCDIVAEVQNMVPAGWIQLFPFYIQVITLLLYEQVCTSTSGIYTWYIYFFLRVRAARYKHMVPCDM